MKRFSFIAALLGLLTLSAVAAGPVKVFILAGQSNMEGHAKIATFDYIGDDPATAPLLKEMRNPDGTPKVCDHVWISNLTSANNGNGEGTGKVAAGFGARDNPSKLGEEIGPEFTFGLYMDKISQQPVLIIKTAWGGKSLHTDFRPPSAGPYVPTAAELKNHRFDTPEQTQQKIAATGRYFHYMIEHVRTVLKDIKRVVPDCDEQRGYELAGFVWFQGFNDLIATETYLPPPGRDVEETKYEKYSEWLADLIRDVRKDLNAPKMPVVIGVMGIGGPSEKHPRIRAFREAMAAPTAWPEFKGNVVAVPTAPFWDDKLGAIDKKHNEVGELRWKLGEKVKAGQMTQEAADQELKDFETKLISPEEVALWNRGASNGDYHYLGCTKTMAQIGRAFAEALIPPAGGNSAACPKPAFLDLDDEFLQPGGSINPETMWDYLHPNESGYRIWADAIQPYIARYVPRKTRIEQH